MTLALQILFDSMLLAGLLAVGALGFTLVWGVLNVLNLTYPAFIMLGAYTSYALWSAGLDFFATLPLTMAAMFVLGWLVQRYIVDYVMNGPHALNIALTYGLNLVAVGLALYFLSAIDRSITVPDYLDGRLRIADVTLPYVRIVTVAIAVALTAAVWWLIDRTTIGAAIRATRLDSEAARLVGIDVKTIFSLTTGIAAALAGAMGALVAFVFSATPHVGDHFLLQILIVTVLGGLGSVVGPLLGAVVVGVALSFASHLFGSTYSVLVGTAIVLAMLVVRPSGLLGRRFYEA